MPVHEPVVVASPAADEVFPHIDGVHEHLHLLCRAADDAAAELQAEVERAGNSASAQLVRAFESSTVALAQLRAQLQVCEAAARDLRRLCPALAAPTGKPVGKRVK